MPVRAGRKQPLPGYKTAKAQIEETPHIATREMAYYKNKENPRTLVPAAITRKKHSTRRIQPGTSAVSYIHTHTGYKRFLSLHRHEQAKPSNEDKGMVVGDLVNSNLKFWHIGSISKSGELIGYTTIHASKKLLESKAQLRKLFLKKIAAERFPDPVTIAQKIFDALLEENAMRIRFFPMPGYKYNKEKWCFEKK